MANELDRLKDKEEAGQSLLGALLVGIVIAAGKSILNSSNEKKQMINDNKQIKQAVNLLMKNSSLKDEHLGFGSFLNADEIERNTRTINELMKGK